jgi:Na+/phosphate symporter
MIILLPLLVALGGLLLYGFGKDKLVEVGRLMFFAGLLVTLFEVAPHVVNFLGK